MMLCFFFFKQKTAYEMRIRDWSSDVCSSDLVRSESYKCLGDEDIPKDRYIDPAYAKREFETLWKKTWQFACREEHIPEVGDYHVYDLGTYSFIITRVAADDIRAYYNACLHHGTKLRPSGTAGNTQEFKCTYHGWTLNIAGSHKETLCDWGFPHDDFKKLPLPHDTPK